MRAPPDPVKGRGFVYVLELDNGLVKIGQTRNPPKRLRNHEATARIFDCRITRAWFSEPLYRPRRVEGAAMKTLIKYSHVGEWLRGVSFAHALSTVRDSLHCDRAPIVHTTQKSKMRPGLLAAHGIGSIPGQAAAIRVWLHLLSLIPQFTRGGRPQIALESAEFRNACLLTQDAATRALRVLEEHGSLTVGEGKRAGTRHTREIELSPIGFTVETFRWNHLPFVLPPASTMRSLSSLIVRARPATAITLAYALLSWASVAASDGLPEPVHVVEPTLLTVNKATILDTVGASSGLTFQQRLQLLEGIGLVTQAGKTWRDGIIVNPPRLWKESGSTHPSAR